MVVFRVFHKPTIERGNVKHARCRTKLLYTCFVCMFAVRSSEVY